MLFDMLNSKITAHYPYMFLDGFKPHEIYRSLRKKMLNQAEEAQEIELPQIVIKSEVQIKK